MWTYAISLLTSLKFLVIMGALLTFGGLYARKAYVEWSVERADKKAAKTYIQCLLDAKTERDYELCESDVTK